MEGRPKISIFVLESQPIFKFGLVQLIEQQADMEICESDLLPKDLTMLDSIVPSVILIDLNLPDNQGAALLKTLNGFPRHLKTIAVSQHSEYIFAARALRAGARGFISKQDPPEAFLAAIRSVHSGRTYLSDVLKDHIVNLYTGNTLQVDPINKLSDRQFEVWKFIGTGLTSAEIADKMGISQKTVESHKSRVIEKLKLQDSHQLCFHAIRWAQQNNLI